MMKLWIYLGGGHRHNGLFFGVISNYSRALKAFLKVKIQNWNILGSPLTFNYFGGYA